MSVTTITASRSRRSAVMTAVNPWSILRIQSKTIGLSLVASMAIIMVKGAKTDMKLVIFLEIAATKMEQNQLGNLCVGMVSLFCSPVPTRSWDMTLF
jgi:hypothetical protein